ncbi:MAG: tetrathionate reductase family octaheme c-type cytochrome [Anaerolineae bacterium]|nr:MAG: tetrathionate reductase family octaheme c-type cytochrome [Anaerolineae bacterium]
MKHFKYIWVIGLGVTLLIIALPVFLLATDETEATQDPWTNVPDRNPGLDHTNLIKGPLTSGPEVTEVCLSCHEEAGEQMLHSTHWTWKADPAPLVGRDEPVAAGKANLLNNFCIGIQSNWTGCTTCHAGYGWSDANYDFSNQNNIDCLACHADTGTYAKTKSGLPADGVDLVVAARTVGIPTRENCGSCHFNGGGGPGVKHGDLDESLYYPLENVDVHMGELDFLCIDCHQTEDHQIGGRSMTSSIDTENQIYCTDCHDREEHEDSRINDHTDALACQTCHVPQGAVREPTKMEWDWSTAGQDLAEDPHEYLKIKGSFVYEHNFTPEYAWFNGLNDRYLLGDPLDPSGVTVLNEPLGDINDPDALIWPFKIHRAKQIYDTIYNYLLQPQTVGNYWIDFDWDKALRAGAEAVDLPYSGEYGFTSTEMYWPLSHMVAPSEQALQCTDCHGDDTRMDWEALGYPGDPMTWGGRDSK